MTSFLFDPRLWLGLFVGFAISESRPRKCPECSRPMEPIRGVEDIPAGINQDVTIELSNMLDAGYSLFKQKLGEQILIRATTTTGDVVDLFRLTPASSAAPADVSTPAPTTIDVL